MTPANAKGFFITLEGPEGSGKSTHARASRNTCAARAATFC